MKTIIIGLVVFIVCLLIGFGIWYAFTGNRANPVGSETPLQQPAGQEAATSSVPALTSYYESENTELYTALSIILIPTKLGKESINGIEIMLRDQQIPLPEPYQVIINANITGELQKEWTCEILQKIIVRCEGLAPLALNESTSLALYYNQPPALPERIQLRLLHNAAVIMTVEASRR